MGSAELEFGASMEPPCEHGGVLAAAALKDAERVASMEPPCEHGGVERDVERRRGIRGLQWSRRVNTAECVNGATHSFCRLRLQWSRRVNTAEWRNEGDIPF